MIFNKMNRQISQQYLINEKTTFTGVIGKNINHGAASDLCNELFKQIGLNAVCLSLNVAENQLGALLQGLLAMNIKAAYVSTPYKHSIFHLLDEFDSLAAETGIVNLIVNLGTHFKGYNIDACSIIDIFSQFNIAGKHVLILGAKNAGTACAFSLARLYADITVLDVDNDLLESLGNKLRTFERSGIYWDLISRERVYRETLQADIVINATDVGYGKKANLSPIPAEFLRPNTIVFDAVNTTQTPLLRDAYRVGAHTLNRMDIIAHNAKLLVDILTGTKHSSSLFDLARDIGERVYLHK